MQGCCQRQCTEARSADQSARSAGKKFPLFFSYQDGLSWHLHVALQVPDVKGLQDPGLPCASISC